MKRLSKIGRLGRAAIVAALGAGLVLLAIPSADASSSQDTNVKTVHRISDDQVKDRTLIEWE